MRRIQRIGLRLAWVALAAGIVMAAAAHAIAPSHHVKQAAAEHAKKHPPVANADTPIPGSEAALRLMVADAGRGEADQEMSAAAHRQLQEVEPLMATMGPLQSITYLRSDTSSDIYQTTFKDGSLIWGIAAQRHVIESLHVAAPEGPTPQDWIASYTLTQNGKGAARIMLAFAKFLAIVGLGRLAGLRL